MNCAKKLHLEDDTTKTSNCSLFAWRKGIRNNTNASCSAETYTGSVCRQQLLAWQECAVGGAEDVHIELTVTELSQAKKEKDASQFLRFLSKLMDISHDQHDI